MYDVRGSPWRDGHMDVKSRPKPITKTARNVGNWMPRGSNYENCPKRGKAGVSGIVVDAAYCTSCVADWLVEEFLLSLG